MDECVATTEIERWLKELHDQCAKAEFQEVYKAGWRDALTSLMVKMDAARKRRL